MTTTNKSDSLQRPEGRGFSPTLLINEILGVLLGILLISVGIYSAATVHQDVYIPPQTIIQECYTTLCTIATWQSLMILGGIMLVMISVIHYMLS